MEFEVVGEWFESLIWCPSQCYLNINVNGKPYHIYLRWRHEDPWSCEIVTNHIDTTWRTKDEHVWFSPDLFKMYNIYLKQEDPVDEVEKLAVEVVKRYFERLLNNKCVYCGEEAVRKWKPNRYYPEIEYPVCNSHFIEHLEKELTEIRNWLKHLADAFEIKVEKLNWLLGL